MTANKVNTNVNRELLIGKDKLNPYSDFFMMPTKSSAISVYNLPEGTEVRFQAGFFDDSVLEKLCKCFIPPAESLKYVGSIYLRCPSCNEDESYVRATNDNPFIILDSPQAWGHPIRAVLVNSFTGEPFDISDPVAQAELEKVRVYIHFDVGYEAKTEEERGCTPFCPPEGDWEVTCDVIGWTEDDLKGSMKAYPKDELVKIESCAGVTADSQVLGYLLKESKSWANKAVYDCDGGVIGYGMANEADCFPCRPKGVSHREFEVVPSYNFCTDFASVNDLQSDFWADSDMTTAPATVGKFFFAYPLDGQEAVSTLKIPFDKIEELWDSVVHPMLVECMIRVIYEMRKGGGFRYPPTKAKFDELMYDPQHYYYNALLAYSNENSITSVSEKDIQDFISDTQGSMFQFMKNRWIVLSLDKPLPFIAFVKGDKNATAGTLVEAVHNLRERTAAASNGDYSFVIAPQEADRERLSSAVCVATNSSVHSSGGVVAGFNSLYGTYPHDCCAVIFGAFKEE